MSATNYTIGLDYGTNSVRTLIVNVANGREVASAVWNYTHGTQGVILARDPNLARQHPADYVTGAETTIKKALAMAKRTVRGFTPEQIIGIGVAKAGEITELARKYRPQYLAKCGGTYSSEWFFSKILHCLRTSPEVFDAAYLWVECADWVPATLTGTEAPDKLTIGICAAGHKGMFNDARSGYPDAEFLAQLDL